MRAVKHVARICVCVAIASAFATNANADLEKAKKELETAKKAVQEENWSQADLSAKMAELELDGVADADKKPITDEADAIIKKCLEVKDAEYKAGFIKQMQRMIDDSKQAIAENNLDTVFRNKDSFDYFVNRDDVKKLLTADEIAKARAEFDKYYKMAQGKRDAENIDIFTKSMEDVEKKFKESMDKAKAHENEGQVDMAVRDASQEISSFNSRISQLPKDNEKVKAMHARLDEMQKQIDQLSQGETEKRTLARLKDGWKTYEGEYKGWEDEQPVTSFEQWSKESSEKMSAFGLPQSRNLVRRASYQLEGLQESEDFKKVANNPEIKAFVDNLTKARDTAQAKIVKAATGLVESAEKTKVTRENRNSYDFLKSAVASNVGEKAPEVGPLQERLQKKIDEYEKGVADKDKAQKDEYDKLVKEAEAKWPSIAAKYPGAKEIDPANPPAKGSLVILKHRANRASWEFGKNDYAFVNAINGKPVAANYDPALIPIIDDVRSKTGSGIGDEYFDIIGELQTTCNVQESVYSQVLEQWRPSVLHENCPLLKIIAFHAGPVAAAVGDAPAMTSVAGAIGASGGGGASAAASSGGGGWGMRILFLLVGFAATAAALLKAGYAPAVIPNVGEVQAKIGGENLGYVGLACAVMGVIFLLMGKIIFGLLPNAAIIVAGAYAGMDFLVAKGIVKPDLAAKIKPLGVPIGLACGALVILHVFIGGSLWII